MFECLLKRYRSALDCCRGRGSGCSRPGYGIMLLVEVTINPTVGPPKLTQDWGNRLLESRRKKKKKKKTLCAQGPRRKKQ